METAKPSKNYSTYLDTTIELISRDVGVATTTAIRKIIEWIGMLAADGQMQLAEQLETLQNLLSDTHPDSTKIAESLEKISQLTLEIASTEEGAQADKIRELGETLRRAAGVVRG